MTKGTFEMSGWVFFAAIMLIFAGLFRLGDAIWAFGYDGAVPEALEGALLGTDLSVYGWWWLAVAALLFFSGIALFSGSQLGRWIGIIAGFVSAFGAMTWMPYYPIWSATHILIAILVVYGLAAHGSRPAHQL
ncbi:MAG: hypothetical protein MUE78_06335 [Ilumatobacteraceae bacterium]|jgi:hypothetical protein|nr:hypothetical protein [Ilumatobacteraceae bacterium]